MKRLLIAATLAATPLSAGEPPRRSLPVMYLELAEVHAHYIEDKEVRDRVEGAICAAIIAITEETAPCIHESRETSIKRILISLMDLEPEEYPHLATVMDLLAQAAYQARGEDDEG